LQVLIFRVNILSGFITVKNHIKEILTKYWGYSHFRELQEDIILSVIEGNDTLALMPTGGGKSICFQVPALAKEGICIVVSPLISLIKDQVEALKRRGIPAVSIISGMRRSEIDITLDNCIYGNIKFLYVTPERLATDLFLVRLQKMKVNLLAIDEAHCISQWGYDFRPAYLQIAEIRKVIPSVPVLALTATATPEVRLDICDKLLFKKENVFTKSFARKNLSYVVFDEEDKFGRLLKILEKVPGSAIVYVRNRRKTKDIADFLIKKKIKADYYHAGLEAMVRHVVQERWMKEEVRVIVATNAFGMGIDKNNVRVVVHFDLPDSPEAYFQESGRAGRDEQHSYAVLLYNQSDIISLKQGVEQSFPEVAEIKRVYRAVANYYQVPVGSGKGVSYNFDLIQFANAYNLKPIHVHHCLKILELQGLLSITDSIDMHSRVRIIVKHDDLYEFQVRNPMLDHIIKTVLRSYEGVFDNYIELHEKELSIRCGIREEELKENLNHLEQLKIVNYIPANDTPQLVLMTERLDERDISIDRQHLAERKERQVGRIRSIINYVSTKSQCRSQMLLHYFGEEDSQRCGVCDYCLRRNKLGVSELEFSNAYTQVKSLLAHNPLELEEVIHHIHDLHEDKSTKVIEWLIDNDKIRFASGNLLEWIE
jgi:ATP-dependent DNA helicase RecQ